MRSLTLALLTVAGWILAGCGHVGVENQASPGTGRGDSRGGNKASANAKRGKGEIVLAPEVLQGGVGKMGPWLAYGASKSLAIDERGAANPNAGVDDFDTEYAARAALADAWKELRGNDAAKDPYLDLLVTV